MASFFGHAAAAVTFGRVSGTKRRPLRFWLALVACATVADLDAIGFWFGVPYQSQWGHRGFTHSLVFAAALALVLATELFRENRLFSKAWWSLFGLFFVTAASHPLFDALTDGGLGVAIFWPFDDSRYFLPYRPIAVSPIGISAFFSEQGLEVLMSESLYIFGPCLVAVAVHWMLCKRKKKSASSPS